MIPVMPATRFLLADVSMHVLGGGEDRGWGWRLAVARGWRGGSRVGAGLAVDRTVPWCAVRPCKVL